MPRLPSLDKLRAGATMVRTAIRIAHLAGDPGLSPLQASWNGRPVGLVILTVNSYIVVLKALVTSKGQVTIPKELRDKFGIEPGAEVDFVAASDGIRLRKVVDRS